MWETAEKIGFIVIAGVMMVAILRSSGELGSRSLKVDRPAHFEGRQPEAQGGRGEAARAGEHGGPGGEDRHGHGYAAYDPESNVGRQVLILVVLLAVLLGIVGIGNGSLGIFWY